tara:strand:+ start:59 stop:916 length:858 start_codon:yes stop_codon:yes gene_type:complete
MIKNFILLAILFVAVNSWAQKNDLLDELEADATQVESFEFPAFKAMKIGNLQSTKVSEGGDMYMYVSHRFGTLKDGVSTFFGLDNANTKIQLLYGIVDGFQVSLSRESLRKTYAGSAKVKIIGQSDKFPLFISAYTTINYNSAVSKIQYPNISSIDRLSYSSQLLLARRFSDNFSIEIAPTHVRQNIVFETGQLHDIFALGVGGRFKLNKRISLNTDYIYNFNRVEKSIYRNPLTIGIDIETGGHVFQLLFSNAQSTNEPSFISNAEGDWNEGNIFFGFNIVRVF